MQRKYLLGAAAAALAVGLMGASPQAAPLSAGANDVRAAIGDVSSAQTINWGRRRYYGGYYYGPRRDYGYYEYYRPYRYYGYGPGFGFYAGPRYYRRGWW